MTNKKDLNEMVNYTSSRELAIRDAFPYFPLKNEKDYNGQLSATDVAMLDYYTDLMYEEKLPLSVILMEKRTGLPTFHQMKALLMEKSKEDGMAFIDALVEGEHEALFGKLWKESIDAAEKDDILTIKMNTMLNSMLGSKMKAVLSKRDEFDGAKNVQVNHFHGVDPRTLFKLKDAINGE